MRIMNVKATQEYSLMFSPGIVFYLTRKGLLHLCHVVGRMGERKRPSRRASAKRWSASSSSAASSSARVLCAAAAAGMAEKAAATLGREKFPRRPLTGSAEATTGPHVKGPALRSTHASPNCETKVSVAQSALPPSFARSSWRRRRSRVVRSRDCRESRRHSQESALERTHTQARDGTRERKSVLAAHRKLLQGKLPSDRRRGLASDRRPQLHEQRRRLRLKKAAERDCERPAQSRASSRQRSPPRERCVSLEWECSRCSHRVHPLIRLPHERRPGELSSGPRGIPPRGRLLRVDRCAERVPARLLQESKSAAQGWCHTA